MINIEILLQSDFVTLGYAWEHITSSSIWKIQRIVDGFGDRSSIRDFCRIHGVEYSIDLNSIKRSSFLLLSSCRFEWFIGDSSIEIDLRVIEKKESPFGTKESATADTVSTREMMTPSKPVFPLGTVFGTRERLPLEEGDVEGGLRTQGIYKKSRNGYPLISYVTVTLNRCEVLKKCAASVWKQNYPNIEYIVIDGNSNDGTRDFLEKNADKIDYYVSQNDSGIYNAMNKGISLASGDYLCFMNSDDECLPNAATTVADLVNRCGSKIICGTREFNVFGKRQEEITHFRVPIENCVFRYIQAYHQSLYASREAFEKAGPFDEGYKLLSDWIWISKCFDAGIKTDFMFVRMSVFNYDGASFTGMKTRDDDWIKWIMNTFPYIDRKDATTLLYTLDKDRATFFKTKTIKGIVEKHKDHEEFIRAVYKSCIYTSLQLISMIVSLRVLNAEKSAVVVNALPGKYRTVNSLIELEEAVYGELYRRDTDISDVWEAFDLKDYLNDAYDTVIYSDEKGKKCMRYSKRVLKQPKHELGKIIYNSRALSDLFFRVQLERMTRIARRREREIAEKDASQ